MTDKLSAQQQLFADSILAGMNQRDAYKAAGYKCKDDPTTDAAASRLLSNVKIADYLASRRQKATQSAEIDLQWLIEEAAATYHAAKKDGAYGPAVSALKEIGVLTGERVERSERRNINQNADELTEDQLIAIATAGGAGASGPQDSKAKPHKLH